MPAPLITAGALQAPPVQGRGHAQPCLQGGPPTPHRLPRKPHGARGSGLGPTDGLALLAAAQHHVFRSPGRHLRANCAHVTPTKSNAKGDGTMPAFRHNTSSAGPLRWGDAGVVPAGWLKQPAAALPPPPPCLQGELGLLLGTEGSRARDTHPDYGASRWQGARRTGADPGPGYRLVCYQGSGLALS